MENTVFVTNDVRTLWKYDILRSMQPLRKPEAILGNVIVAISIVFPQCSNIIVKMLTSKAGDIAQVTHTDYVAETEPLAKLH